MDNPTKWNITNSAQNIVSALVDSTKQYDNVFRREWHSTFASFSRYKPQTTFNKYDADLKLKLKTYLSKLDDRKYVKQLEDQLKVKQEQLNNEEAKRSPNSITGLVPEVFMSDNFDLSNLDTFNRVISLAQDDAANDQINYSRHSKYTFTHKKLKDLQLIFTDYLDVIEENLANRISNRSGDFFQVMSSVDSVMDELSLAIKSVTNLRHRCANLNDALVKPNMKIIQMTQRRNRTLMLLDKMKQIQMSLFQIQVERFVNSFHEECKARLETLLNCEQWKVVDHVPTELQQLLTKIVDDKTSISEVMIDFDGISLSQIKSTDTQNSTTVKSKTTDSNHMGDSENGVRINDEHYVIVQCVISFVCILIEYCKCACEFKSLSAELLERLIELLQLFNTRTFHLVYSAGAVQVAGLKTITTRSLVISQRSLRLIIHLITPLKQHFTSLMPEYSRLKRFDDTIKSYSDHVTKIPDRIVSIVKDVIDLELQDWTAKPPIPSQQFEAIAQHLMRLHDNIRDVTPHDDLRTLFLRIDQTFKEVLTRHLKRLNISMSCNEEADPQKWLVKQELTFYKVNISKLSVYKDIELNYEDLQ